MICPSCSDAEMTPNARTAGHRRDVLHTCGDCGYSELR